MHEFTDMTLVLKPAQSEHWAIEHFEVSKQEADHARLSAIFNRDPFLRMIEPGKYVRLRKKANADPMMSNTPSELSTNLEVVRNAHGRVLIGGLGLGAILVPILRNPRVLEVTVVELEPEVIDLVEPQLRDFLDRDSIESMKLIVEQGDIYTWVKGKKRTDKFDTIYFDIWPTICADNYPSMCALRLRYKHLLRSKQENPKRWMGAWLDYYIWSIARREGITYKAVKHELP